MERGTFAVVDGGIDRRFARESCESGIAMRKVDSLV